MSVNKQTGYGQFTLKPTPNQIVSSAHRISYETFVGSIAGGMCVMHKCDNRRCFNPSHLQVGTIADNNHDMIRKGRQAWADKSRRVTHCRRGHERREIGPTGRMRCTTCEKRFKGASTTRNKTAQQ